MVSTTVTTAKYGTVITDVGAAKLAAAILSGKKVNITHGAVGDGGGAYYKPTASQTALIREWWRGEIAYQKINEGVPNMIDVKFIVPAEVGGAFVREAALIDEEGDTIAICNTPDAEKIAVADGVSFPLPVVMHILVTDVSAVTVTVNPSLDTVSREEMEDSLKKYAAGVGSVIIKEGFTIPASAWIATEDAGKYKFVADVADEDVLDAHFANLAFDLPSLDVGSTAGVCPTIETLDGLIRFWSKRKPTADLCGTLQLRSENLLYLDGEGSAASDKDVEDAIEDVFGEDSSAGDDEVEDDTTEEEGGDASGGGDVATDEEVKDTIEDIFGETTS